MAPCAIVTTCQGRTEHLRETAAAIRSEFPSWRRYIARGPEEFDPELPVWAAENGATVVPPPDGYSGRPWCKTDLINGGVSAAIRDGARWIQLIDADFRVLGAASIELLTESGGPGRWGRTLSDKTPGWCLFHSEDWQVVPRMIDWGAEDWLIRASLFLRANARPVLLKVHVNPVQHSDVQRLQYCSQHWRVSSERNLTQTLGWIDQWAQGRKLSQLERAALWESLAQDQAPIEAAKARARERGMEPI